MGDYRVVCINDRKKPNEIPSTSWIEEGEIYTVTKAMRMSKQRMTLGYLLDEVSLPEDSKYECYIATRFRPYSDDDAKAEAAVEELLNEQFVEL